MSQGGGNAFSSAVIKGYHAAVAQGELYLALALLARNLSAYGAVNLVGQPVFASDGFQLEHTGQIFIQTCLVIGRVLVMMFHIGVAHDGFR